MSIDMLPDPKILSEEAIDAIANDVRTRPLAEVGRHVMPLIHHLIALDARACHTCRSWVPYDHVHAHKGECLNADARRHLLLLTAEGEIAETTVAIITPFDWCCKGWLAKSSQESPGECQVMQSG